MKTSSASRLTRVILAALFSQKACTSVVATLSIVAFLFATTDHPQLCALTAGAMMPWMFAGLKQM